MNISDIIKSDPIFQKSTKISYQPLNGGYSNETYIVKSDDTKYVVKINFPQNEYLQLTRRTEVLAQIKASELGIAPMVYSNIDMKEYVISEYIEGHLLTYEEVIWEDNLIQLGQIMKQIHSIEGIQRECSPYHLIESYCKGIKEFKVVIPYGYNDIMKQVDIIRKRRELDKMNNSKYCHNDMLTLNLLYDDKKITVIDWELSGIGDPYMDLATIPYSCNFDKEKEKILLKSYFGYYEEEMHQALNDLKYIGVVREMVWGFFFAGLNKSSVNHDLNYYEAGQYALNQLKKGLIHM